MQGKQPWLDRYVAGVPAKIEINNYQNLPQLLEEAVNRFSDQKAFVNMGRSLTYRQVGELSDVFAQYLTNDLGLKKGDRIGLQLPNVLQYPICIAGALKAGLVVVNTNPLYTAREMAHQYKDAGVKAIVIVENFASKLQEIKSELPELKHIIITTIGEMLGPVKGVLVNFVLRKVKKMVPKYHLPGAINLKSILSGPHVSYKSPRIEMEDIALLQYTGGTTGVSKGAIITHKNLLANALQHRIWLKSLLVDGEELIITALPLYHIFALTVNFFTFFMIGTQNVLITNPRDIPGFIKELSKFRFTTITGVNTLFNSLMNNDKFTDLDFSKLKLSIGGGMAVLKPVAEKWTRITGNLLMEGYGLTECSPVVCIHPFDGKKRIGTIGIPLPSTDVRILDDEGKEVPIGEHGELCVRGPQVMKGYWKNVEETELVFFGEYLRTGDIGYMDSEGFFYIVDRKKEMINVSGFNVYPKEIEDVLSAHPKVLEVGVIGVQDEKSNEAPMAFIVKKDESLTEQELTDYCKKELTSYKRPRYFAFRTELPKTNVGKILRKELK